MTSLAMGFGASFLSGQGSPPAGDAGRQVQRITGRAFDDIKGVAARSSGVFNDLRALAQENEIESRGKLILGHAQRFLLALPGHLPAPELSLDEDGDVVFDWHGAGQQILTVALRADGRLSYACWITSNDLEHGAKNFADAIPRSIIECIQQVTGK